MRQYVPMEQDIKLRRLLVLRGPSLDAGGIIDLLREHFDILVAEDTDEAAADLRKGRFDAVLAETADFLPLQRGVVTQQAEVILDTLGDGVCVVGPKGELAWANRKVRGFSSDLLDSLRKLCWQAYEAFASARSDSSDRDRVRRFALMPGSTYYEVICSPIRDEEGLLRQVVAVVVDATTQRRQQLKLNAIGQAGRELVRLDDEAVRNRDAAERLGVLEERIIRYSREVLDYQNFAVMLLHEATNRLEIVVSEGLCEETDSEELFASPEGNGICGYVAATGRSYICPDVRKDSRYVRGLADARSSLTVPLRLRDRVIGVMNVESDQVAAFGEEDRQFAEIFANYVALALHILNLLVSERHSTHTQLSSSIAAELAGPINDIVTETSELLEDYIGLDDLRKRLNGIVDRASRVRRTVRQMSLCPACGTMVSPSTPANEQDPVLGGKRVLVADDEDLIRQTVCDVLSSYGCQVDVACDGNQAKELVEHNRYDLVVSDIKMPGASGYEVFAAAKALSDKTEVILMTAFGYDPNHSIVRANKEGLAVFLLKPFKVNRLLEECRSALTP